MVVLVGFVLRRGTSFGPGLVIGLRKSAVSSSTGAKPWWLGLVVVRFFGAGSLKQTWLKYVPIGIEVSPLSWCGIF